ncbi:MAG: ferritin [Candidatus Omnitrophica bacterium]|nr:ferritin [Candidatus Omnitrophota bacterium]
MLSDKMVKSINGQINKELYSAYLYLGMSSYAASMGLNGFANWFSVQVKEELSHAQKFYDYVTQQGRIVELGLIEQPDQAFNGVEDAFKKTLEHEIKVTSYINNLVAVARAENDNATGIFLQWFVTEQVEEEANASAILQKIRLIGGKGDGLFMIDKDLAARVFTPPPVV